MFWRIDTSLLSFASEMVFDWTMLAGGFPSDATMFGAFFSLFLLAFAKANIPRTPSMPAVGMAGEIKALGISFTVSMGM